MNQSPAIGPGQQHQNGGISSGFTSNSGKHQYQMQQKPDPPQIATPAHSASHQIFTANKGLKYRK